MAVASAEMEAACSSNNCSGKMGARLGRNSTRFRNNGAFCSSIKCRKYRKCRKCRKRRKWRPTFGGRSITVTAYSYSLVAAYALSVPDTA
eukprot:2841107-Rhodomonas_salina.1